MKKRLTLILLVGLMGCLGAVRAQKVALKTNLLYDAALSPNLGIEVGLAPKWTFDLSGNVNAWKVDDRYWKHWLVQPEVRYWLCDRWQGHFFGAHLLGGQFNLGNLKLPNFLGNNFKKLEDYRYQGWGVGAGIAYGYSWIVGRHWNIEAEIGLGWVYTRYDKYPCTHCGDKIKDNAVHNYVGPTKAAVNLIYVF